MGLLLAFAVSAAFGCGDHVDRSAELNRPPPPKGVSGVIVSVANDAVDLRQKDGTTAHVAMTQGWTLSYAQPALAKDIKVGQFMASANLELEPGAGRATEVRLFEPGYVPEFGTHQVGAPGTPVGTAMTHGFVFAKQQAPAALDLEIRYPGGCRVIRVPEAVKVTNFVAVDRALARPGTAVSAVLRRDEDGVMRAGRLTLDSAS